MRTTTYQTSVEHPSILAGLIDHFGCAEVKPDVLAEEVFQDWNLVLLIFRDETHAHMRIYTDGAPARLLEEARTAFPDAVDITVCLASYCDGTRVDVYRATNVFPLITKLDQGDLLR